MMLKSWTDNSFHMSWHKRLQKRWEQRQARQSLLAASVDEVQRQPEAFEIEDEMAHALITQELQALEEKAEAVENPSATTNDLQRLRKHLSNIYKIDRATAALTAEQAQQMLEAYLPAIEQGVISVEADEWLYAMPSLQSAHLQQLVDFLGKQREPEAYEPVTYLRVLLKHPSCNQAVLDQIAKLASQQIKQYAPLLSISRFNQHPRIRRVVLESGKRGLMERLIENAPPDLWKEVFEQMMENNPEKTMIRLKYYPPPEGVALTEKNLLPALTSSSARARELGLRALKNFSPDRQPAERGRPGSPQAPKR